jgi:Zn-dependent protease
VRVHILFVLLVIFQVWPSAGLTRLGVGAGEQILWNLRWIGLLFGSVLLHEFGHCFGCRAVGGRADNILMWPLGGLAFCDPPRRPWPEFVTVACGPLVNVLLAGGSYAALLAWLGFERMPVSLNPFEMWREQAYWLTAHSTIARLLADLFVVNYALLLFNVLLIFYPFDGGRLVQIALWVRLGYQRSMWIATTLGMFGAVGVAAIGLWQFSQGGSLLLTLIGVFGFITCRQQRQMLRYADMYEPDVDSRFAAAYESADGRRGAWFGSAGVSSTGDGGDRRNDRSPGMFARWKQQRATRQTESRRRQVQSDEAEVNRILDKVRERGLASLTPGEKEMLQRATDRERSR